MADRWYVIQRINLTVLMGIQHLLYDLDRYWERWIYLSHGFSEENCI